MRMLPRSARTICVGEASSMAAVILAGGAKNSRTILPNGTVMIHDPVLPNCSGPALTIDAISQRLLRTRHQVSEILAECTCRSVDEILQKPVHDRFFNATEAAEFGLADNILKSWGRQGCGGINHRCTEAMISEIQLRLR